MKEIYNKLIRDNIPEIIRADNAEPVYRTLDDSEFIGELFKKLSEETKELIAANAKDKIELMKEIGDVYEVIDYIIKECGLNQAEIIKLKEERKQKRGGFDKKLFLESIDK
jgi:predicted house-cleaning noncanonical NTP pyrophosphatase (MazG superfamily)